MILASFSRLIKPLDLMFGPNLRLDLDPLRYFHGGCNTNKTNLGPLVSFLESQSIAVVALLDFGARESAFTTGLIRNNVKDRDHEFAKLGEVRTRGDEMKDKAHLVQDIVQTYAGLDQEGEVLRLRKELFEKWHDLT